MEAEILPVKTRNRKMSIRQERFCSEYLIDFNATQAALRAGYAPASAKNASQLLDDPKIRKRIEELNGNVNKTNIATAEVLIHGLERGDLDWRDIVHPQN